MARGKKSITISKMRMNRLEESLATARQALMRAIATHDEWTKKASPWAKPRPLKSFHKALSDVEELRKFARRVENADEK